MKNVKYHSNYLDQNFRLLVSHKDDLLKKYSFLEKLDGADGLTFISDNDIIVWLPQLDVKNPRDISVFAHEVSHAAIFGLDIHDVPFFHRSRDGVVNSEALSYLIGELTENLLKKYTSKR